MDELQLPHKLTLTDRAQLSVTGVSEVIGFDENQALMQTPLGLLTVYGSGLQLKTLSPEGGQVLVEGAFTALVYEQGRQKGGFWSRLLG